MARGVEIPGQTVQKIGAGVFFLMVVTGGVLVLLYFWNQLLQPGDLNAVSLPVVAMIAGVAATFNPCGMPALPGFLAMGMGDREPPGVWRRGSLSLVTAFGAMTVIVVLGIIVAFAGTGTKGLIAPYFRWVQLTVGLILVSLAVLHFAGQTSRMPLVGRIMGVGSRMWEETMDAPTPRGSYIFGMGFVAVGVG